MSTADWSNKERLYLTIKETEKWVIDQEEVFKYNSIKEAALRTELELANQRIRELEKLLNETLPKLIESIGNGTYLPTDD